MKSEPDVFSIEDLARKKTSLWDGVRNYEARNFMTQAMKIGDTVLFYHSNAAPSGIAGLARVCESAIPDPSQFDKKSEYYAPKATLERPIWFAVTVEYVAKFPRVLSLDDLRAEKRLQDMLVLKRGQRLSIQPVLPSEYKHILKMAEK